MNYTAVADLLQDEPTNATTTDSNANTTVTTIEECIEMCQKNEECFYYQIETDSEFKELLNCEMYAEPSGDPTPVENSDQYFVFGEPDFCLKALKDTPAVPEDAEELSYKETCTQDQYEEKEKVNNTWVMGYCPSKYYNIYNSKT